MVRLLVLGGGGFLGYHAVAAARAAGHDVTVFGRSGRPPLPGVEVLVGDREGDLDALHGRTWDAVFDTYPGGDAVRATGELLSGAVGTYGYVSGMSVYAPDGPAWPDESAPVRTEGAWDDRLQERSLAKLAGERALAEVFDGPVLLPRVGIMVGPRDPTHRFAYWPHRFAAALAGERDRGVLAPGDPHRPVQYSDARDVAAWAVAMLAAARGGVFNVVGPGLRFRPAEETARDCLAEGGAGLDTPGFAARERALRLASRMGA